MLHGGAARGDVSVVSPTQASVLRMVPVATRIATSALKLVSWLRSIAWLAQALSTRGRRSPRIFSPTKSLWNTVWVVEGRTCASAM